MHLEHSMNVIYTRPPYVCPLYSQKTTQNKVSHYYVWWKGNIGSSWRDRWQGKGKEEEGYSYPFSCLVGWILLHHKQQASPFSLLPSLFHQKVEKKNNELHVPCLKSSIKMELDNDISLVSLFFIPQFHIIMQRSHD